MKENIQKFLKIIGIAIGAGILLLILLVLLSHFIGSAINNRKPENGINESLFIDINGSRQWISIYGENTENPVLLYLHGGPGSSTSAIDYAFTRQWADVFTVVTWDQRNCGKSYSKEQNGTELTYDLLMEDGKEVTEFILNYLNAGKLTILGHSWGSIYGANLVQAYPEFYDCFIGTGQLIDSVENELAFKALAAEWAAGDEESMKLVSQLDPEKMTVTHFNARNALLNIYGYGMMRDGSDYNLIAAILFNPYYSLMDWIRYFTIDMTGYLDFFISDEFKKFSIQGKYTYAVPYININGGDDYQTNHILAEEYFEKVTAPEKRLFIMEHTTHGLLESKSRVFSDYVHEIVRLRK